MMTQKTQKIESTTEMNLLLSWTRAIFISSTRRAASVALKMYWSLSVYSLHCNNDFIGLVSILSHRKRRYVGRGGERNFENSSYTNVGVLLIYKISTESTGHQ